LKNSLIYRKFIEGYLEETAGDVKKAIDIIFKKEYEEKGAIKQEKNAYIAKKLI
jgi:hypothetical protein